MLQKIGFYLLNSQDNSILLQFLCKLTEKIYRLSHQISIELPDRQAALALDTELWRFRASSFIPHCMVEDPLAKDAPIVLYYPPHIELSHDVLIPMTLEPISVTITYNRLIYLVDESEINREKARQLFRYYREQGITPSTHTL